MAERWGVAKLFPETLSERPPSHGTLTLTPRPKNSTGGFGLAKNVRGSGSSWLPTEMTDEKRHG